MTDDKESRFIAAAKAELDRSTQQLDELTIARLRAARRKALEARPHRLAWLGGGGGGAAPAAPPPTVACRAPGGSRSWMRLCGMR